MNYQSVLWMYLMESYRIHNAIEKDGKMSNDNC